MQQGVIALFALFGALYFIQGFNETSTGLVTQPVNLLLKTWGNNDSDVTTFMAMLSIPWCLKPLFGLLSDFVPLAGMRRKSYLVAIGVVTSLCFLGLSQMPLSPNSRWPLLLGLLLPTLAVTFGDVVLDALIIEAGRLRGITDRLQSVRWGANTAAAVLTGSLAGILTQHEMYHTAFLACGLLAVVALVLSTTFVREPAPTVAHEDFKTVRQTLFEVLRSRKFLAVGAFLFLWHLNPCTSPLVYLHMTKTLKFSEEFYGVNNTLLSSGSAAACLIYGFYCRRIAMRLMVPASIACGIISTLAYFLMADEVSAVVVSVVVGFTYMTANMIQCDLAARVCPVRAAGTIFSMFMALCNIGTDLSMWIGGHFYQWFEGHYGSRESFQIMLIVGAVLTLGSWSVARLIRIGPTLQIPELPEGKSLNPALDAALTGKSDVDFTNTPLSGVLAYLQGKHGIEFQIDDVAFEDAGRTGDVPVTLNVVGVSFRSLLELMFDELDMTCVLECQTLVIKPRSAAIPKGERKKTTGKNETKWQSVIAKQLTGS